MKLKKMIYTAAFTLLLLSPITTVLASGKPNDYQASHIIDSAAFPNDAEAMTATYEIEVHVQGKPLEGLSIDIPSEIKIDDGIEVKNSEGEKIATEVSINENKAQIIFSQPVAPETKLSILMKDVITPGYAETWQFKVDAKIAEFTENIPLGVTQINTYDD